ncbi:MAG: WbqC family protein, partial [Vulcanimicrobiota bacterium]
MTLRQDRSHGSRTTRIMRVSIHQPHYLAWLPYLGKIVRSDVFIILDDVEFTRNGYQNRNRIKTAQGALTLTVPVKQKLAQKIMDVAVAEDGWRKKHWASIQQAYRKAPFFKQFEAELQAFYDQPWSNLADPVSAMLEWLIKAVQHPARVVRSSSLGVTSSSTQRLVELVRAVDGTSYLSGAHALQAYLDPAIFEQNGMPLELFDWSCPTYPQAHGDFVPNLAALDALFYVGPEATLELARRGGSIRALASQT